MDHHLPRYHVRPPRGFLNDPNGPVVLGDRTHLFFQYRFTTDLTEPVVWGHVSSADLAHWTDHRPAISPLPGGPDADGCWSGNTVATDDGVLAFYSGAREERRLQAALVARSTDGGASFGDPVELIPEPEGLVEFRDPFVWWEGSRSAGGDGADSRGARADVGSGVVGAGVRADAGSGVVGAGSDAGADAVSGEVGAGAGADAGSGVVGAGADAGSGGVRAGVGGWRMALGAGTHDEVASVRMWTSPDLVAWTPGPDLASAPRTVLADDAGGVVDTGGMWECPQVLEVDDVRVALVGAWGADTGIMRVLAMLPDGGGDRLGGLGAHPVDDGTDFYAPSVLRDGPRGPLVWGWITEGRDADWWREVGWAGAITLPREVRLGVGGRLLSAPAPEVVALRRGAPLEGATSVSAQVEVRVRLAESASGGMRLVCGEERLEIRVDASGDAVIDRARASLDPRAHAGEVRIPGAVDGAGELRVFVDGSVLEVFTSTGRVATTRVYPTTPPPWRLEPLGAAGLTAWELG